ncbi:hypothetical protein KP509_05G061900 [Ceratopteris richardii]|uniref:DUF7138 domain-containing protein n=1 Tax=Ceratopteris richardii TaxID=49495 RepID=A0A8T2UM73_CERRI|nr:hypothetical protein KP509_05G061900 [Ceratopteris richardii]KAH7437247.1 hypothetical protein KP509_05G061900 [Ceratopteris richardii]
MESFATPYPVFFHDGEREHDKGHIGVHSVLTFKRFQALLSQKVGLPAGQISAVFVCRRTGKDADTKRQKLPINENTNFNIILNQHNPKSEKDCHFLVSMKKSKKERKGNRRRSADAENGDDFSVSPRGDLSPRSEDISKDEGCGDSPHTPLSIGTAMQAAHRVQDTHGQDMDRESQASLIPNVETLNQERHWHTCSPKPIFQSSSEGSPQFSSSSPRSPVAQPSMLSETNSQFVTNRSPETNSQRPWLNSGAASDMRQNNDKIFLRRDPTNLVSPVLGWQNMDKAIDSRGYSRPVVDAKSDKPWLRGESLESRPILLRNDHKWGGAHQFQLPTASRNAEGLQERYNESLLTRPPILLQRNGIMNLSGASSPPAFIPATRPLVFAPMENMILPRVSSGITGLASGSSAAMNLQQAQAHYLNLQAQQSEQTYLNLQALSKMRGVVRGLASYENGNHKPSGVCQHCYRFQERKINPTPFHLCVHDRITNGFRGPSPAGPIERPGKRVEAAA